MTSHLLAFLAMLVTDASWALYVAAVRDQAAFAASSWSVLLFLLGGLVVVGYTRNPWLLVSGAAGAFAGTFIGVVWNT